MRPVLFAIVVCALAVPAAASPQCASPAEVKLLKAVVLEQVLTAASQSCHLNGEFSRFVTAYHEGMVKSDHALKVFFASRSAGEGYDGYKSRIAKHVALKSLHDANFCADASKVFAIALKQENTAPPALIATGYENCGVPASPAQGLVTYLAPEAAKTVTLPIKKAAAKPAALHIAAVAPRKLPVAAPQPRPAPVHLAAIPKPPVAPAEKPLRITAALHPVAAPVTPAPAQPLHRDADHAIPVKATRDEAPSWSSSNTEEEDTPYRPGDNIPNAYKPGATWVRADFPSEPVPPAEYQPRPPAPNLYLGIDNRWHLFPSHHRRWGE